MTTKANWVITFDLDDTLYQEIDYYWSAHREIAKIASSTLNSDILKFFQDKFALGETKLLDALASEFGLSSERKDEFLKIYRDHMPQIELAPEARTLLDKLKAQGHVLALITDGRSLTQRNKIKALGLQTYFDHVFVSDEVGHKKPDPWSFQEIMSKAPNRRYVYIADNVSKDFIAPNALGWKSIGLRDQGRNIHSQKIDAKKENQPQIWIDSLNELLSALNL